LLGYRLNSIRKEYTRLAKLVEDGRKLAEDSRKLAEDSRRWQKMVEDGRR